MSTDMESPAQAGEEIRHDFRIKWLLFYAVSEYLGMNASMFSVALSAKTEDDKNEAEEKKQKYLEFVRIHSRALEDRIDEILDLMKSFNLSENQREDMFCLFRDALEDALDLVSIFASSVEEMKSGYEVVSGFASSFHSKMPEHPEIISQEEIDALLNSPDEEEIDG